ncbi:hypothetical protein [Thermosipho atlanticus]|uniref:Uncharacterized protein n=1 Tax=Thermosipho atlanticus DSM 15807 TaxID=1123380 RepID=A0A1M5TJH0_9BACT|nr:hypothetical protein [Thermosipho atlanticus]SHH50955.1 hypothetical protein SAMN02745199_1353 [Thermosipho atlanticus DSM 15807]
MKKWVIFVLVSLFSVLSVSNALKYLPEKYEFLIYIPDIAKLYDEVKKTNTGDIFANQVGLESMITSVLEQQLMVENYTLEDIDLFKELLIAGSENNLLVVLGPSKNPQKIKEIFEKFTGQTLPDRVKIVDGYFIVGENYGGGEVPPRLKEYLTKNYLGLSYVKINDKTYEASGYGYIESKNNTISFYQEIEPENEETKRLIEEVSNQQGMNILEDNNVGGDVFLFVNRKIPEFVLDLFSSITTEASNTNILKLKDFKGTAYLSADISSLIINALSGETPSSIPYFGVIYYDSPNWDLLELDVNRFENIGGKKYGVITTEEGTPVTYIGLDNDKIVFYGVSPDKYKSGDRSFIENNYNNEYIMGLFVNFEPTIFNFVGIETEAYLKVYSYIKDGKIIQRAIFK